MRMAIKCAGCGVDVSNSDGRPKTKGWLVGLNTHQGAGSGDATGHQARSPPSGGCCRFSSWEQVARKCTKETEHARRGPPRRRHPQWGHALKALSNYAGAYRFGLAGVEVDEARTWSEVVDDVTEGSSLDCLVLSDESYSALGRPKEFSSFGLAWRKA